MALLGGIQFLQEPLEVPQAVGPGGVLEGLVLGKGVDETLADVVAVPFQEVAAAVAQARDDLADLGIGAETVVRHSAAALLP